MKVYSGSRTDHGCVVTVADADGCRGLDPRYDLRRHGDGFEWGYCGSGPAQLALALAADVLGDDEMAEAVYQRLKVKLVAKLPPTEWALTADELSRAIWSLGVVPAD
jgi:hypothetical protein